VTVRRLPLLLAAVSVSVLTACSGSAGTTTGSAAPSPSIAGVQVYTGLSHEHLHTIVHLNYPQTPPVGGEHAPYWLNCAIYTSAVPNEFAVHSMEHGAVWLTYLPDVAQSEVNTLVTLSKIRSDYVIVSPYPGQPAPIIATAWGLQLQAQTASDPRVKDFVDQYVGGGQGGEPGVSCAGGVTPEQAQQFYKG
jgi:hypothetical protein